MLSQIWMSWNTSAVGVEDEIKYSTNADKSEIDILVLSPRPSIINNNSSEFVHNTET